MQGRADQVVAVKREGDVQRSLGVVGLGRRPAVYGGRIETFEVGVTSVGQFEEPSR